MSDFYIGLMSGTSMDAVDAVLLSIVDGKVSVAGHHSTPLSAELRSKIHLLSHPGEDSLERIATCDREIAFLFADAAQSLLHQQNLNANQVKAIGSHGQTIRHHPDLPIPYTVQLGDPSTIAAQTGIITVADFRRKDIALGGQGAPLAPAFHHAMFQHQQINRAVINIGGIANITWLPAGGREKEVIGFDTGPGNTLLDIWAEQHLNTRFDQDGAWAGSGECKQSLLTKLLEEPYLHRDLPRSTGKELFNGSWLSHQLEAHAGTILPKDIQATLCHFTAASIALGLKQVAGENPIDEIFICGGGAHNPVLLTCLRNHTGINRIETTASLNIDPSQVEGAAFAWLAYRTLHQLSGNLPSVTGASRLAVLGGIYYP